MGDDCEYTKTVIYYMVYKNVVNLVNEVMKKLKGGVNTERWKDREAKIAWIKFEQIAFERYAIISTMKMRSRSCSNYANVRFLFHVQECPTEMVYSVPCSQHKAQLYAMRWLQY